MSGWISINRKIQGHWLWNEKREFSKLEAWFDILLTVNHSEQKVMIKNVLYTVKRGESIKSLETWSNRWNWNKSKVRRFFKLLESDSMIVTKNETKTTRLTVCKYDDYQDSRNANETQMKRWRNANETMATPNNNDNNINNENNENNVVVDKPDDDIFKDLEFLKTIYLQNEKLVNAFIENKANKIKNKKELEGRLSDFITSLTEKGRHKETFKEFSSYFRNWNKKAPKVLTNLTDAEKHKAWLSNTVKF